MDDQKRIEDEIEHIIEGDTDDPENPSIETIIDPIIDDKSIVLTTEILPAVLPILPIQDRPAFPKMLLPLVIEGKSAKRVIMDALKTSPSYVGLLLTKTQTEPNKKAPKTADDFYRVGTVGKIVHAQARNEGQPIHIMLQVLERFEALELQKGAHYFRASANYWHEDDLPMNEELKAYAVSIIDCIKELIQMNPIFREEMDLLMSRITVNEPGTLADFSAFMSTASREDLQEIIETRNIRHRLEKVLILLKKDLEIAKLQNQINQRIEERLSAQQREFFLKEQLKEIKKELGLTKEDSDTEVDKFKARMKRLKLTDEAKERIQEELDKLQLLDSSSPDFNVTRAYLDWLTILPWGKFSKDKYDLVRARKVLEREHYGLQDVKERILEFISVGKVKGDLSGSIILLVGPPGVGKTSIGQSIAKSIGRQFFRFSLGGMRDEAEIKGHRRTYIGALPGKFINAIKTCKTSNPVIMLDEIDKIGMSFRGDPASALLEVLDPEQNKDFLDHYLDVRFDLSKVLFICTANQLETIPPPLLDRMEVIRLSGYILEEKIQIAKKHLLPKQLKWHGLKRNQISISLKVLRGIIDGYAREAGVRNLENQLKKLLRKAAKKIVENNQDKVVIQSSDLKEFLGRRVFEEDKLYKEPRVGVITGLAYTSMGGATLYIEATKIGAKAPGFKQTGQLGSVMVESSEIAYTYVRSLLDDNEACKGFFVKSMIHLHVPAGATPKDGPSAGIAMACALYSLAMNQALTQNVAMTGELTLTGLVMPIGGVKEKLLAAKRAKLEHIIFPKDNQPDFEELEEHIREGITPHFFATFAEVLEFCFQK